MNVYYTGERESDQKSCLTGGGVTMRSSTEIKEVTEEKEDTECQ